MHKQVALGVIAVIGVLGGGCGSALHRAVRATLPSEYSERRPADDVHRLGAVLLKEGDSAGTAINGCYSGKVDAPSRSWGSVEVTYSNDTSVDVNADFGGAVAVTAGTSGKNTVSGSVVLEDTDIFELSDLFMLPASRCATDRRPEYARPEGALDSVIVRAVRAGNIDVKSTSESSASLKVKLPPTGPVKVEGGVTTSAAEGLSLKGSGLYYAQVIRSVRTKLFELPPERLNVGQTTGKNGACFVKLRTAGVTPEGQNAWSGELACDDGQLRPIKGEVNGTPSYQRSADGVSYSVAVKETELPGKYEVQYSRWVVNG